MADINALVTVRPSAVQLARQAGMDWSARALVFHLLAVYEQSEEVQDIVHATPRDVSGAREERTVVRQAKQEAQAAREDRAHRHQNRKEMLARMAANPAQWPFLRSRAGQRWIAGTHTLTGALRPTPWPPLTWLDPEAPEPADELDAEI